MNYHYHLTPLSNFLHPHQNPIQIVVDVEVADHRLKEHPPAQFHQQKRHGENDPYRRLFCQASIFEPLLQRSFEILQKIEFSDKGAAKKKKRGGHHHRAQVVTKHEYISGDEAVEGQNVPHLGSYSISLFWWA